MQAQMDRQLQLLVGGPRDRPARQRSLRGAIDWSYDLLAAPEQALFRQLAVFVGGADPESIAAVIGDDACDLPARLESLADKSLLGQTEAAGRPRYGMLEPIRQYALECLAAAGELASLRARHAAIYVALAETGAPQLNTAEQAGWIARFELEHDNLRSALR